MTDPRSVINALGDIDAILERCRISFQHSAASAESFLAGAEHAVERCRNELEYELNRVQQDLDRALGELRDCQRQIIVDRDGYRVEPNCSEEEREVQALRARVEEVQHKLYQLRYLTDILETAKRDYYAEVQRMRSLFEHTIPKARDFIQERREALENFERWGGGGSLFSSFHGGVFDTVKTVATLADLTPKFGKHGYAYQKARQQFLRSRINDPNEPRHVRGWIQQELNRLDARQSALQAGLRPPGGGNRIRGVPGYDVGHRIPGIDLPDNFRLEDSSVNRARPGIVRRLGLDFSRYR
jgi:hypothetical protein